MEKQMDKWMMDGQTQADGQMDGCLTYQPHPLSLTKSSGLNLLMQCSETDCREIET